MKKILKIVLLIIISIIILCSVSITLFIISSSVAGTEDRDKIACPALPADFKESDLVGTWIGQYFQNTDKLIIRANGTYKQIFSSDSFSFESEWKKWSFELDPQGYGRLRLEGMRRCGDDLDICNTPGGGLPTGVVAINPCEPAYVNYANEVILFVSGYRSDDQQGIVLRHAKLAGSDWSWGYQIQK